MSKKKSNLRRKDPPCLGCLHMSELVCDILGIVDEDSLKICNRAGYKEIRSLNSRTGHYHEGAYWTSKDRGYGR